MAGWGALCSPTPVAEPHAPDPAPMPSLALAPPLVGLKPAVGVGTSLWHTGEGGCLH